MRAIIYLNKILITTKKLVKKLKIYHQINKEKMHMGKIIYTAKKVSNDFIFNYYINYTI